MRNEATEEMLVFTTEVCWKYEPVNRNEVWHTGVRMQK